MTYTTDRQQETIGLLHSLGCSCVIDNGKDRTVCHERGVKDLMRIYHSSPTLLAGSFVADKVIGKGAAAIMTAAGVKAVYADVISHPALEMFKANGVEISYATSVPNIINRAGTDICPVERLCMTVTNPDDCIPIIRDFIKSINKN